MIAKNLMIVLGSIALITTGCSNLNLNGKQDNQTKQSEKKPQQQTAVKQNTDEKQSGSLPAPKAAQDPLSLQAIYFNEIKQVNGKNRIQNPANLLALVNKNFYLPDQYIPSDLVRPAVSFSFGNQNLEKALLRKVAAQALEKMFSDAKKAGIELFAVSGYRSFTRQKILFDAEVKHVGEEKAEQAVAVPGSSEHQSGLAMDIGSKSTNFYLTEGFSNTKEGKWLAENAHRYGFILRYPKGKEAITNYEYEPWHFRYVGEQAAAVIYEHKWSLEEYFHEVKKI